MPVSPPVGMTAAQYAQELDAKYPGQGIGAQYLAFAEAHPRLTPLQAGNAWALSLGLKGFGAGLGGAVGGTGKALGQIAQGSGQGMINLYKGLNLSSLLLRIGEVIVGVVLIGIGINSMAKGKPFQIVTGAAGMASKVIP